MFRLEPTSSSLPGKFCFVLSSDWRGYEVSISLHELSRISAPLPLFCLGMGRCRKRSFLSLGEHCMAVVSQFTYFSVVLFPAVLWSYLKTGLGRDAAQVCTAVLWKGFTCANCVDLNLHRRWHNKAYIPGSFFIFLQITYRYDWYPASHMLWFHPPVFRVSWNVTIKARIDWEMRNSPVNLQLLETQLIITERTADNSVNNMAQWFECDLSSGTCFSLK